MAARAADLESGKDGTSTQDCDAPFPVEYYIMYAISLFLLVLGVWAFLFPFSESRLVGNILGSFGMAIASFMMLNADLLVTYLRLLREMQRFKQNNQRYRASLCDQKAKVGQLKGCEKALKRLDRMCHGHLNELAGSTEAMTHTARDATRRTFAGLMMVMYPKAEEFGAGADLKGVERMFYNVYGRTIADLEDRFTEMHKGLDASQRYSAEQSLSATRVKFIMTAVLFEGFNDIKGFVESKAEAATDELATGWHSSATDAFEAQKWASQYQENGGRLTVREPGVAPLSDQALIDGTGVRQEAQQEEDDDWADAEDFVNGG